MVPKLPSYVQWFNCYGILVFSDYIINKAPETIFRCQRAGDTIVSSEPDFKDDSNDTETTSIDAVVQLLFNINYISKSGSRGSRADFWMSTVS